MRFRLRVFSPHSGVRSIEVEAASIEEAALTATATATGLAADESILEVAAVGGRMATRSRAVRFPLLPFSQEMLSLMEAGLTLVEAVDVLAEKEGDPRAARIIAAVAADVRTGLSLSRSLANQPEVFPPLYRAAIEASEKTGGVEEALRRFIGYETRFQALRTRLLGALIYPVVLLTLGGLVTLFLLGYVVPRFSAVFADRLEEMPFLSSLVVRLGMAISAHAEVLGATFLAALAAAAYLLTRRTVRATLLRWAWALPWLGERWHRFELVRLYRSLGMLLRGGVPAVAAMERVAVLMPANAQAAFQRVIDAVSEGQLISRSLMTEGFSTKVADRMLAVGEKSGRLGEMLERAADFIDEELTRTLDWAMRLMEPILMLAIGAVVGAIVMLMYLPIFELADSVR